jgi:hypothetical protein
MKLVLPPGAPDAGAGSEYGEDMCRPIFEKGRYDGANSMILATLCATF